MRSRRSVATLCLGVLLLRAFVPGAMHTCATTEHRDGSRAAHAEAQDHSQHAAPSAHAQHSAQAAHPEHSAHSQHAAHSAHAEHAAVTANPNGGSQAAAPSVPPTVPSDCDCASWCCCVPTFAQVASAPTLRAVVAAVPAGRIASAVTRVDGTPQDRRLPFANAPPAV